MSRFQGLPPLNSQRGGTTAKVAAPTAEDVQRAYNRGHDSGHEKGLAEGRASEAARWNAAMSVGISEGKAQQALIRLAGSTMDAGTIIAGVRAAELDAVVIARREDAKKAAADAVWDRARQATVSRILDNQRKVTGR